MTEKIYEHYIGIDVAKNKLDVCVRTTSKLYEFTNDNKGYTALRTLLNPGYAVYSTSKISYAVPSTNH